MDVRGQLSLIGVLPVAEGVPNAAELALALMESDVPCLAFRFELPGAKEAAAAARAACPQLLTGFLIPGEDARCEAEALGAAFAVTEKECADLSLIIFPVDSAKSPEDNAAAASRFLAESLDMSIAHVGINSADEAEAMHTAEQLCRIFGWPMKVGGKSVFSGTAVEVMKMPFKGRLGHVGIRCDRIRCAKALIERRGFEFDESSANVKDGQLKAVYLREDIAGFAFHLVQK